MPYAKVVTKGITKAATSKPGRAALAGTGAVAVAETIEDNPYVSAAQGALLGAQIGSAVGGPGIGTAVGAVGGAIAGYVMADGETIVPTDMIAVPAFEWSAVRQGMAPTFMIHIKEGELITPILPTDAMMSEAVVDQVQAAPAAKKKRKRLNAYQRFTRDFSFRAKRRSETGAEYGRARMKAISREWKKSPKNPKNGGRR